jgi:hypothetical protein
MDKPGITFFRLLLPVILLLAAACQHNRFEIDTGGIEAPLSVQRFEEDLFGADPAAIADSLPAWKARYGEFLQHFSYVLKLGDVNDPDYAARLVLFTTDHSNYQIYKRTREVYARPDTFINDLTEAFRHYRYYFPDKPIPRVVTFVSGLTQSAITDTNLLAIGLDKYLGADEALYREIGLYRYLSVHMYPEKLVPDCMAFWGETEFPFYDSVNNLLSNMVYRGRLMYFTKAMVPSKPDTVNWGFTKAGLEFCSENERAMWTNLIENKLLFSTDRFTIDKFIQEGPFTKDFGRGSPSRAAVWTGYRIVAAYMDKNPGLTLSQLMQEKDYMKILNLSAYNP